MSGARGQSLAFRVAPPLDDLESNLHPQTPSGVDTMQERSRIILRQVFVNRFSGAFPRTVIVDENHTPGSQDGKQVNQIVPSGFIPIRIEPEQGDLLRHLVWNGIFHSSLYPGFETSAHGLSGN